MSRNPQAQQMGDSSMLVNLAAQVAAIWPQEEPLLARYSLPPQASIADIGCGSGEIGARLARRYPDARVVGVDVLPEMIASARRAHAMLAPRLSFQQGDAFDLRFGSDAFDLVVCRHLTQAVPQPELVLKELVRVCKPGGWVHVVSEDYGMLHFPRGRLDPDRPWQEGVAAYSRATNVDERIGRRTWTLLRQVGLDGSRNRARRLRATDVRPGQAGRQARRLMRDWSFNARTGCYRLEGSTRSPHDLVAALRNVSLPVLSVAISGDPVAPPGARDELLSYLPAARVTRESVPGVVTDTRWRRHFSWARRPGGVAEAVAIWLRSSVM